MGAIRIVIADDHTLFRVGLKRILSTEADLSVVGEAANGDEAVRVVHRTRPNILLFDLKMPSGDAVPHLLKIAEKSPATKVIILTAYTEPENLLKTAKAYARGYVLKGISAPTLVDAIKKVHAGGVWVDRELAGGDDFERLAESKSVAAVTVANEIIQELSKRELEILNLVAMGLTNEEIGRKIYISELTVKTHLRNIFDKLQVNNRFKAALFVMQQPSPAPTIPR